MNITIDPLSPTLLLFEVIYIGVSIGLLAWSAKAKTEWGRAGIAGFAIMMLALRSLAIWPSWWLYYAEGEMGWGGQGCVELDLSCLKQTVKDTIVVIQNGLVLGVFVVAFLVHQKKFPKQLGPGEEKLEATGGYK